MATLAPHRNNRKPQANSNKSNWSALYMIDRWFAQWPSEFSNAFYGLRPRWRREISPKDLGKFHLACQVNRLAEPEQNFLSSCLRSDTDFSSHLVIHVSHTLSHHLLLSLSRLSGYQLFPSAALIHPVPRWHAVIVSPPSTHVLFKCVSFPSIWLVHANFMQLHPISSLSPPSVRQSLAFLHGAAEW